MMKESKREQEKKEEPKLPLYGDILDSIVSRVPTLSLLTFSHVSPEWHVAVISSLRRHQRRRTKPWFFLHFMHPSHASVAYDPHSNSWTLPLPSHVTPPSSLMCSPLLSSPPNLFFTLSPFIITSNPLSSMWHTLSPPRVHRKDPIVAKVNSKIILAGGTCDFEGPTCHVEVNDLKTGCWITRDPMPNEFSQSSSAMWLSTATSDKLLFILEKSSGLFTSFDVETGRWSRTCELKPDPSVTLSAIGYSNERLILVGLSDPLKLTVWEVDLHEDPKYNEIGCMPDHFVERLVGEGFGLSSIGFSTVGDYGYFYNPVRFEEGFVCEFGKERWESIGRPKEVDENPTARILFGCAAVGLDDLKVVFQGSG